MDFAFSQVVIRRPDALGPKLYTSGLLRASRTPAGLGRSIEEARALGFLQSYSHPQAKEWVPEEFQVFLTPARHAREPSLPWPAELPDLEEAKKWDGETLFFNLNRSRYPVLKTLLDALKPSQGVLLNGQTFYVWFHFPLPGESPFL